MSFLLSAAEEKDKFILLLSYVLYLMYIFIRLDIWTGKKIPEMQGCTESLSLPLHISC